MKVYRFRINTNIYRPQWTKQLTKIFGERNNGFLLAGENEESAYEEWVNAQLPGDRINRGYISITEEK